MNCHNPDAYSHASASGLWQFIPTTGRISDLRVAWWLDEPRDPDPSRHAALQYPGELQRQTGSVRPARSC